MRGDDASRRGDLADDRDPRTATILAAAFEVHNTLGPGFEETLPRLEYRRLLNASREPIAES